MKKILLVEPDKQLADIYAQAIVQNGYQVNVSNNAFAAIRSADENSPDLLVLELQLVEHSGVEFLYEFRSYAEWQAIPLVIMTNIPVSNLVSSIDLLKNQLGLSAYLYKPRTSLAQLLKTIDSSLGVEYEAITN